MRQRTRSFIVTLLIVLGGAVLAAGIVSLWVNTVLLDSGRFTRHATDALQDEDVRAVVADALVDQIITHGSSELMTVRPLLQVVVAEVVSSRPFRAVYQPAVREMHASIFAGEGSVALQIVDFMVVLSAAVETFDPALAEQLPEVRSTLIELRRRDFATGAVVLADHLRPFGWMLPVTWFLLHGAALLVAPDRRRAMANIGFSWSIAGALVIIAVVIGRILLRELVADPAVARAAVALARIFGRELVTWSLILAVLGVALAACASSSFRSVDVRSDLDLFRRAAGWLPGHRAGQVLRALIIVVVAGAMLRWPEQIVGGLVTVAGLYLLYIGLVELIRASGVGLLAEHEADEAPAGRAFWRNLTLRTSVWAAAAMVLLLLGIAALALFGVFQQRGVPFRSSSRTGCNGYPELCDRRLNEVAFAATHNSMSAAAEPGWFFASHADGIRQQLEFGVRGFLIDVYYGIPTSRGVRTDLFHDRAREELVAQFGEEFVAARDRMVERMEMEAPQGERALYMCHGFCELGATPLDETLVVMRRFLETNPRDILIVMIQDEVPADQVAAVFTETGLAQYAYTYVAGSEWPTLGEMIERDQRLLVMAENDGSGPDWYHAGFELTQETPYSFRSADEFSCEPHRGRPDSPLFLLNHWIERVTPSPGDADEVNRHDVLLRRALKCQNSRRMIPNLVAVNFYRRGDVLGVVRTLNGVDASYRD